MSRSRADSQTDQKRPNSKHENVAVHHSYPNTLKTGSFLSRFWCVNFLASAATTSRLVAYTKGYGT
jgi:hypothetical protein